MKSSSSNGLNGRKRYTPEFKAQLVQQMLREEKSVAQLAAEHGIHPNQLYQWRDQALQALPSAQELAIKRRIDEIYTAHPFYGIRRISAQLRDEGQCINHKAVARHMREMGLAGIAPGPSTSRGSRE